MGSGHPDRVCVLHAKELEFAVQDDVTEVSGGALLVVGQG